MFSTCLLYIRKVAALFLQGKKMNKLHCILHLERKRKKDVWAAVVGCIYVHLLGYTPFWGTSHLFNSCRQLCTVIYKTLIYPYKLQLAQPALTIIQGYDEESFYIWYFENILLLTLVFLYWYFYSSKRSWCVCFCFTSLWTSSRLHFITLTYR